MLRSAYVPFFAIPALSEAVLSARDFALVRAMFTRTPVRADAYSAADTMVLWGECDLALDVRLLSGLEQAAPRRRFPHASHWVHADEHERVVDALVQFLR